MSGKMSVSISREEHNQSADRCPGVECGREYICKKLADNKRESKPEAIRTIIFCPPVKMTFSDHVIEYEPNKRPWYIVDRCGWWNPTSACQDNRDAKRTRTVGCCHLPPKKLDSLDVFENAFRPSSVNQPSNQWC